jgi:hypothetical protein
VLLGDGDLAVGPEHALRDLVQRPEADRHAGGPAGDERLGVEPAGVEAQRHRRQRLQHEHAADELQVDGELRVEHEDRGERPDLHDQRRELAAAGLLLGRRVLVQVLLVDVARPQVGRRDRHDRRRDQGADADGGEGHAGEPARELLLEQQRHDGVAVGRPFSPTSGVTPAAIAM